MSELTDQVEWALSPGGPLARLWPDFKPRKGQTDMARAVAETVVEGGTLVVEAGTGVGKTFAYLAPVLLSGQRALVSTATKALQDQLFSRDLPRLAQALNVSLRVALLKGRSSYLCIHRMAQARHSMPAQQTAMQRALSRVEQWAQVTKTGDLAELPGLDESSGLWPSITSTRDNCLGSSCPSHRSCHVILARKEAMAADLVVINHHLFFADMAVRESGVAELLPAVRVTVFDEAHQLNEIGVHFLGQELSTIALLELARDSLGVGLTLARGLVDWQTLSQQLETAARDWRLSAGHGRTGRRLRWSGHGPQELELEAWRSALSGVDQALQSLSLGLGQVTELAPDFQRMLERCQSLRQLCERFCGPAAEDAVRWVEVSSALKVIETPLDIAQSLNRLTQPPQPADGWPPAIGSRAWVFTSATLGDTPDLRWFTVPCGLTSARALRVESPFDYARQSCVYVPQELSDPGSAQHPGEVAQLVLQAALRLGGRTLVLTTTLAAMRSIAAHLQSELQQGHGLQVLVQGQSPKRRLMEQFRLGADAGQPGCILVASASFWEGFDVPGDALQLVVIDKLPFAPPDDPVFEARGLRLKQQGRHVFTDQALPEAAVMLKQGAGRLIRSETDQGILVIADHRLWSKGYGQRLLSALPAMRRLTTRDQFMAALDSLVSNSPQLPPGL